MGVERELFTARQIGKALGGVHRRTIDTMLEAFFTGEFVLIRGNKTKAWTIQTLPPDVFQRLENQRFWPDGTERYRSVADVILKRPAPQLGAPLSQISAEDRALALKKRGVLAPRLAQQATTGEAFAALAREACEAFARENIRTSEKTVLKWITTAIERDGNDRNFDREELYTPPRRSDRAPASDPVSFQNVEAFLCAVGRIDNELDRNRLWHAAFLNHEKLIAAGMAATKSRKAGVGRLAQEDSPFHDLKPDSIRTRWDQKLHRWRANGKTPEALGHKKSSGRPPKFTINDSESRKLRDLCFRKESVARAIDAFAQDPDCRPETRQAIMEELDRAAVLRISPQWPISIRRATAISEEERARKHGPKATQRFEYHARC